MIRKHGRSGGCPRKHPRNGYAKYEISDSDSDIPFTDWIRVDGKFKDISVGDDSTIWGVNNNNEIYRMNEYDSIWEKIPGSLVHISHGYDSNVWGVDKKDKIYN